MNGLRRVPGVDMATLDSLHKIVITCTEDGWSPNIWYKHSPTGQLDKVVMTSREGVMTSHLSGGTGQLERRYTYCTPGCYLLPDHGYTVTYPRGLVTTEEYSPPIQPNPELHVTLACARGYATAVGDTGFTSLQCKQKLVAGGSGLDVEWSVDENNRLTCVRGCRDITESVMHGETTASARARADGPPFSPGDVVPFSCKRGYALVGHSLLSCTGGNTWSEELPECVSVETSNAGCSGVTHSLLIVLAVFTYQTVY